MNAALNAIAKNIRLVHDEQKNKPANLQKAYAKLQKKVTDSRTKGSRMDNVSPRGFIR